MPQYYYVTWVDSEGVQHKTLSSNPQRLQEKVQSSEGPGAGVVRVDYSDAKGVEGSPSYQGPIIEAEPVAPSQPYVPPFVKETIGITPSVEESIVEKTIASYGVPVQAPYKPVVSSPGGPVTFATVFYEQKHNLNMVRDTISQIESSPPGTVFRTSSGETLSREQALMRLREQENVIVSSQEKLRSYEQQGYVISRDDSGNIVFTKPVTPVPSPVYQPSLGGFTSFYFSGFTPTFGLTGPTSPEENIKQLQQQMIGTETRRREMWEHGDFLGLGWEVVTSPIPMTFITAGLGLFMQGLSETRFGSTIFGKITLPKILGSKTITATPSTTIGSVLGGAFVGAGAGSIMKTYNEFGADVAKQSLLVTAVMIPVYSTAFNVGKSFYAKLPRELQVRSPYFTRVGAGGVEALGFQKYITILGKRVYMGEFKPLVFKTFPFWEPGPPSWEPVTGVQPVGIGYVKPLGKPGVVPVSWGGKVWVETGLGKGWQPVINTGLIVKPFMDIVVWKPFVEPVKPVNWQPLTGLGVHPSSIKTLDELFRVYRSGKITTEEYQSLRDVLKPVEDIIKPSPFVKPSVHVEPKPYSPPPIKVSISPEGVISSSWYGKKFVETGKGWQPVITKQKGLSTLVYPKPKLFKSYETFYRFLVFEPKTIITGKPKTVETKPFKTFTMKDVVKTDEELTKDFGLSGGQEQRGGTVTVQETKEITKDIMNELVVPEELKKPVTRYETYGLQKTGPKSIFQTINEQLFKTITSPKTKVFVSPVMSMFPGTVTKSLNILETGKLTGQKRALIVSLVHPLVSVKTFNILKTGSLSKVLFDQIFKESFKPEKHVTKIETITPFTPYKPVPEETPPPSKPRKFDFSSDFMKPETQRGVPVYHVKVLPRQYVHGKHISHGPPHRITNKPLTWYNALVYGGGYSGGSAKASFILEETKGKPGKLPRSVKPWNDVMLQFEEKPGNRFVESFRYRIDTLGEINEISRLGWMSHHKKNRRLR